MAKNPDTKRKDVYLEYPVDYPKPADKTFESAIWGETEKEKTKTQED